MQKDRHSGSMKAVNKNEIAAKIKEDYESIRKSADGRFNVQLDKIHSNIDRIVEYLEKELGVREVFLEGIHHMPTVGGEPDPVTENRYEEVRASLRRGDEAINELEQRIFSDHDDDRSKRILSRLQELRPHIYAQHADGEALGRALNNNLKIRGADGYKHIEALEDLYAHPTTASRAMRLDPREDEHLSRVAELGSANAVTVYGGAHDWSNNIKTWNQKHPDKKFSLIVVTPNEYTNYEEEEKKRRL